MFLQEKKKLGLLSLGPVAGNSGDPDQLGHEPATPPRRRECRVMRYGYTELAERKEGNLRLAHRSGVCREGVAVGEQKVRGLKSETHSGIGFRIDGIPNVAEAY